MKKHQSSIGENAKTVSGFCPVDQSPIGTLSLTDRELDIALLSRWFYYGVNVCPVCLAGSSESDFTYGAGRQDSIRQLVLSPYSRLKTDFTDLLPARLTLAKRFLNDLSPDIRSAFVGSRLPRLESAVVGLVRLVLPNIGSQVLDILVNQCIAMVRHGHDIAPLVGKITAVVDLREHLPENHPAACLLKNGGDLSKILQAGIYGSLISGLAQSDFPSMTSPEPAVREPFLCLAQLHLELDRSSIYAHYIARHGSLEKLLTQQPAVFGDSQFVGDLVENHIKEVFAEGNVLRMQSGYDLLLLGRNYYKTVYLVCRLLKHEYASSDDSIRIVMQLVAKAIYYLELSLVSEKYPAFDQDEPVQHLNKKHRITVPFLFGELGVRHMLCMLYNEMVDIATAGCQVDQSLEELGNSIRTHWWKNHVKFRELKFGGFNDPVPVQVLITRAVAFASICSQPGTRQYMQNIIQRNSVDLYARYIAGTESLIAEHVRVSQR